MRILILWVLFICTLPCDEIRVETSPPSSKAKFDQLYEVPTSEKDPVVSVNVKNMKLSEILKRLLKIIKLGVVINHRLGNRSISIKAKDVRLSKVLEAIQKEFFMRMDRYARRYYCSEIKNPKLTASFEGPVTKSFFQWLGRKTRMDVWFYEDVPENDANVNITKSRADYVLKKVTSALDMSYTISGHHFIFGSKQETSSSKSPSQLEVSQE